MLKFGFIDSSNFATRLTINQNGTMFYSDGASLNLPVLTASGTALVISNTTTWVNVEGRLDYATKTCTLSVNNVLQGAGPLDFQEPVNTSAGLGLQNVFLSGAANVPVVLDDLALRVSPFPITFESPYAPGDLVGQGATTTKWIASPSVDSGHPDRDSRGRV